jgi:NAD(P)-dependent dehydrogenase (short-subunit alcohol dehydrogenase family)
VNAICPAGMPYTRFMAAGGMEIDADVLDDLGKRVGAGHPLGKPITAEDCAEAAVFLCSDAASNITGVLLPIDGGYVAR